MSKSDLDWKNESDYAYTAKLTDAGWAWEFIRRSESYRAAYQALKPADFKRIVPQGFPAQFLTPSERAEAMDTPFPSQPRTPAQKKAALWGLFDMYNPDIVYDPDKIHFYKPNGVSPVIYGPSGGSIRPIEEIYHADDLPIGPTTLAIFVDFSRDVAVQVQRIKDVLKGYSKSGAGAVKGRRRDKEWPRYLRMLDAREDEILPKAQKIKRIDPYKKWKQKKTQEVLDSADSSEWSKYADETLKAAERMAEAGFRFLVNAV